jgi:hypothetical protein
MVSEIFDYENPYYLRDKMPCTRTTCYICDQYRGEPIARQSTVTLMLLFCKGLRSALLKIKFIWRSFRLILTKHCCMFYCR